MEAVPVRRSSKCHTLPLSAAAGCAPADTHNRSATLKLLRTREYFTLIVGTEHVSVMLFAASRGSECLRRMVLMIETITAVAFSNGSMSPFGASYARPTCR